MEFFIRYEYEPPYLLTRSVRSSSQVKTTPDGPTTSQEREVDLRSTLTHPISQIISPSASASELSEEIPGGIATLPSLTLCDERLLRLEISNWTDVMVTNEQAARAISVYLETDHPILGLFDADLFLEDLVNTRPNFCSRLLVSSLLSFAFVRLEPFSEDSLIRLFLLL